MVCNALWIVNNLRHDGVSPRAGASQAYIMCIPYILHYFFCSPYYARTLHVPMACKYSVSQMKMHTVNVLDSTKTVN